MTGQEVEVVELPRATQRAILRWRQYRRLPPSYIDSHTGEIDVEGVERAAAILYHLGGVDMVESSLGDTFNIKGTIGFKADFQRSLLAMVPGYAFEVLEIDDEHVVARIKAQGEWKPPITKRITDTDIKHYKSQQVDDAEKNNYVTKPSRMLEARVSTELIDLYAKGVIRGLVRATAGDLAGYYSDQGEAMGELGSAAVGEPPAEPGSLMVPPRSVAPDGSTIPEHLREPEVDDDLRTALLERVAALDPAAVADLTDVCKDLRLPNIRTVRFTRAHGALLARLIVEAEGRHQPVPDDVHDNAPESVDPDYQPTSYDDPSWVPAGHIPVDDDPGRP